MAISQNQYVNITSVVAGATAVAQRQLIGRLFTDNPLLPPKSYIEFSSAAAVGQYFGTSSQEYLRAVYYFGFVSKNGTQPLTLSFSRWVSGFAADIIGTLANTETTVTVPSTFGLSAGMLVTGAGIAAATTIASVTNATTFALSAGATSSGGSELTFYYPTGVPPMIFGYAGSMAPLNQANFVGISDGSFTLTIGGVAFTMTGIDFTGTTTIEDVAGVLQTVIRNGSGSVYTAATVNYVANPGYYPYGGVFEFIGGAAGANTISVSPGVVGTDISALIGWYPGITNTNGSIAPAVGSGAVWAQGAAIETPAATLALSDGLSDNFGSFAFMGNNSLTLAQNIAVANANYAFNVKYMFLVPCLAANISAWANDSSGLGSIGGCGLTVSNVSGEYPEMLPMLIMAATNYSAQNAVQNYEFQQSAALTPSVTTDTVKASYDGQSVNYMGQTQSAGQFLSFYQQGVLFGLTTDPLDMNTYANEQWLKSSAASALMNLLVVLPRISANSQGRSQILATLQSVINQGLFNGSISVGKVLTSAQIAAITSITGDENAFYQVQTSGYWVDCVIVPSGSPVIYTAVYTLVYSKDDVIRKVQGTQILI